MDEILYDDLHTMYLGSVCMYKGEPVKVEQVFMRDKPTFTLLYLALGKHVDVKFSLKDFSAPVGRIGFVNHGNMAWYVTRRPSRQWSVGLKSGNVLIKSVNSMYRKVGSERVRQEVGKMGIKAVALALKGDYPKFEEALKLAVEHRGVYAFDKQFAIDADKNIFYKTELVGKLTRGKQLQHVEFLPEREYLELPLMQHYDKTFRTFGL